MAFSTGSATDLADLMSKISTFATANGWTENERNNTTGIFALSKGNVYVSFRWDATGTINNVSMHQALAWTVSTQPGDHTDDSGNGYNLTTAHTDSLLDDGRCINNMGDGPFPTYFLFENDASPAYLHIVVEVSTDVFRHFGFGNLDKFGDWDTASGGEYAYGTYKSNNTAIGSTDTSMLDGLFGGSGGSTNRRASTIHLEGFTGQPAGSKWGQIWGDKVNTPPADSASNAKVHVQGGFRSGPIARHFGWLSAGTTSGLIPMYPFGIFYHDTSANFLYFLGWQADVRGVEMTNFAPKDSVVIGGDTWYVFPTTQRTADAVAERSYMQGIAYKRIDA